MKKITALLLSAILAVSTLAACRKADGDTATDTSADTTASATEDVTGDTDTPDAGDAEDTADTTDAEDTADTVDTTDTADTVEVTDAPITDAPVTDAPVTGTPVTDAPVTEAPAPPYAAGKLTSKSYNSVWLDLSFTPNKNMTFSSAADLAELTMGDTVCEMMATDKTTLGTAVITVFPTIHKTMPDYFVGLINTYEGTGVEIEIGEISEKKLGGTAYSFALCDMTYMGETMKTATYFRVIGDHTVTVIITYQTQTELDNFIACFSAAK